jgi:PfaD family protein
MEVVAAAQHFRRPLAVYWDSRERRHLLSGAEDGAAPRMEGREISLIGYLPPIYPEWLGGRAFLDAHGVRFAYVCGEMARGIATAEMVAVIAAAGMLGFFGAAGLDVGTVASAIANIKQRVGPDAAWGSNLIHSPDAPGLEEALVDLYLREVVAHVSASAFLALSPAVVRYMATGLHRDREGRTLRRNRVFAKLSRPEVAEQFMSPPPSALLRELVAARRLTSEEAELASTLPIAEDIVAEADSGGHTDNRPLTVLLPILQNLRDRVARRHESARAIRIGAAGGLGAPAAIAAAFAAGADFIATGSVNQASIESALSPRAKEMLAGAGMADVAMAPAADMFEMGVKVQVLRKGTMFPQRAARLYEIYRAHDSVESLAPATLAQLESEIFRHSLSEVWEQTTAFFARRDPALLTAAMQNPKVRLALICRWYLGQSSRWAITGEEGRGMDYQIWCGPAQGAFNEWVRSSFLEPLENRSVVQIALNLLEGAAAVTRAQQLRAIGVAVPSEAFRFTPRPLA